MKVEMSKKYRYASGEEATILTTERPSVDGWCVASMREDEMLIYHKRDGEAGDPAYNLEEVSALTK